jgi:hypothetical protein
MGTSDHTKQCEPFYTVYVLIFTFRASPKESVEAWLVSYRVCIHKATLHKKIDFKTDSFLRLFTDIHLGTYWRLPVSFDTTLTRPCTSVPCNNLTQCSCCPCNKWPWSSCCPCTSCSNVHVLPVTSDPKTRVVRQQVDPNFMSSAHNWAVD